MPAVEFCIMWSLIHDHVSRSQPRFELCNPGFVMLLVGLSSDHALSGFLVGVTSQRAHWAYRNGPVEGVGGGGEEEKVGDCVVPSARGSSKTKGES